MIVKSGSSSPDLLIGTDDEDILIGQAGDDRLIAGSGHDELYGGVGNDLLNGGDGNDYFVGGAGRDLIFGGAGFDTVDYSDEGGFKGISVNLTTGIAFDSTGSIDRLFDIERIRATKWADTLTGNAGNNQFQGLAGADTIDGGAGVDWVDYSYDQRFGGVLGVTVNLATGTATDGFGDQDTLSNLENVRGTNLNDHITGDDADNRLEGLNGDDTLLGGAGNDHLVGGAGADVIDGGTGHDRLDYHTETGTARVIVNLSEGWALDTHGTRDTVSNIESVWGSRFDDILVGSAGNDGLSGREGNDRLFGEAGQDELYGGQGNDLINGGSGADYMVGGQGNDTLDGSWGFDTVDYGAEGGSLGVTVNLSTGIATDTFGHQDSVRNVERIWATDQADTLTGSDGVNHFRGNGGDDLIFGRGGHDLIDGGTGADTLDGGAGHDILIGGRGNDIMTGGAGSDTFRFAAGDGFDVITDFDTSADRLDLSGAGFGSYAELMASAFEVDYGSYREVIITYGNGDMLTLQNVSLSSLGAEDVIL